MRSTRLWRFYVGYYWYGYGYYLVSILIYPFLSFVLPLFFLSAPSRQRVARIVKTMLVLWTELFSIVKATGVFVRRARET